MESEPAKEVLAKPNTAVCVNLIIFDSIEHDVSHHLVASAKLGSCKVKDLGLSPLLRATASMWNLHASKITFNAKPQRNDFAGSFVAAM